MWKSLFGRYYQSATPQTKPNKTQDAVAINKSIIALRDAQKLLDKREEQLVKEGAKLALSAKEKLNKNNRRGALYDLKRKKILDKELSVIANKKLNIERQISALGSAGLNSSIYESLKKGVEALRNESCSASIEEVEELIEQQEELMDRQDAIDEALSRDLITDMSDDELRQELEELEDEVETESDKLVLPELPTKKLVSDQDNGKTVSKGRDPPSQAESTKLNEKHLLLNKSVYQRPKVKATFSRKRKREAIDVKDAEKKLSPAPKKKRSGFSFPKKSQFSRVTLVEKKIEPVANREQKARALSVTSKPRKPTPIVKSRDDNTASTIEVLDKEEASNFAVLETLYD